MTLFESLKKGLKRTSQHWAERLATLAGIGERGVETASAETEFLVLEDILIESDVGVSSVERIMDRVRKDSSNEDSVLVKVKSEILEILDLPEVIRKSTDLPRVVMVVGVNGTGKTTTVGKLAYRLRLQGEVPLICAADTFRAAAVEQLSTWANRAGVKIVSAGGKADPASVVFDAIKQGAKDGSTVVIVDTAGRLHTRSDLMAELEKLCRVASRSVSNAPHEVLLIVDSTVGQNGLVQAQQFLDAVSVTGIVLTKLDGTAKGGVAVAIANDLKVPIQYVGVGEKIDDFLPFSATDYTEALFARRAEVD